MDAFPSSNTLLEDFGVTVPREGVDRSRDDTAPWACCQNMARLVHILIVRRMSWHLSSSY